MNIGINPYVSYGEAAWAHLLDANRERVNAIHVGNMDVRPSKPSTTFWRLHCGLIGMRGAEAFHTEAA